MAAPQLVSDPPDDDPGDTDAEQKLPALKFGSAAEFVEKFLAPVYALDVTNTTRRKWCPEWSRHSGVLTRVDAVWRAWEHYRQDPATGMFTWFAETDKQMAWLMASDGPFELCSVKQGHLPHDPEHGKHGLPPLPVIPPTPPFPDERLPRQRGTGDDEPAERRIAALAYVDLDHGPEEQHDELPADTDDEAEEPYDVD